MSTMGATEARSRLNWILDEAQMGRDTVITWYGTPVAVVIPYEDYQGVLEELEELLEDRRSIVERQGEPVRPFEEYLAGNEGK